MSQEATIRRGVRNARYTTVPNHVFEDVRLSMEARWLLGYLLSKPDNWTVVIGDIINRGGCGRDKARKMIAELVETGYAEREQTRADGKFGASVLVIYDEPREVIPTGNQEVGKSVAFLPQTDLPATAKPSPDSPSPVKSALSKDLQIANTDNYQLRESVRESAEGENPKAVEQAFKRWYATWPTFVTDSEPAARKAWGMLSADERVKAAELSAAYVEAAKASGRKFVCSAGAYLSEKRWEKLEAIAKPADATPAAPGGKIAVPVFGPVWAAARQMALLAGPRPVDLPDDIRDKVRIAYDVCARRGPSAAQSYAERRGLMVDDDSELIFPADFERMERQRLTMAEGYPEANRLHSAVGSQRVTVKQDFEALKPLCEAVPVGSTMWVAWRDWHAQNHLPFVPDPGSMKVVYFPKGGPEGLEEFERAARALLERGTNDDAA